MHAVGNAQFVEHAQEVVVGNAMEMVVTLDAQSVEIEGRAHSADAVVGFEHNRLMPIARQLIGDRQAHGPRAQYRNSLAHPQNSSTTLP